MWTVIETHCRKKRISGYEDASKSIIQHLFFISNKPDHRFASGWIFVAPVFNRSHWFIFGSISATVKCITWAEKDFLWRITCNEFVIVIKSRFRPPSLIKCRFLKTFLFSSNTRMFKSVKSRVCIDWNFASSRSFMLNDKNLNLGYFTYHICWSLDPCLIN